jgi:hypothetical protein
MIRRILAGVLVASIPVLVQAQSSSPGTPCESLVALTIPNVIVHAAAIVAGPFTPPGSQIALTLPAFCRVEATARPSPDSEIRFEVWIPPAEAWNGKFQGVGNGGYQGSISYMAMAAALRRGYATASTDTGHTGDDTKFGQGHPEKVIDYGWRAIHVMTDTAKLIVRNAQGASPTSRTSSAARPAGTRRCRRCSASPTTTTAWSPALRPTIASVRHSASCGRGPRPTARMASHC